MYVKPSSKFIPFLFNAYCAIVFAVLCIVHILCNVKQYGVTRRAIG